MGVLQQCFTFMVVDVQIFFEQTDFFIKALQSRFIFQLGFTFLAALVLQ